MRSVSIYTNIMSALPLAVLSAWGLHMIPFDRFKIAVSVFALVASLSFDIRGNLYNYWMVTKSQGLIYNADILTSHPKIVQLAARLKNKGRLTTIKVVGDANTISTPGYDGNWLQWLYPVLPQAYGIETTDFYINVSPRPLFEYYLHRIGSRQTDPGHYAFIEIAFDGYVRKIDTCFVQTDPIDIDAKGFHIDALRDAAVNYVISPVAIKSAYLYQDELSDAGPELGCIQRGYFVWPEGLGRPKIFIYRTKWNPQFVSDQPQCC